jgi:hypothetical protein
MTHLPRVSRAEVKPSGCADGRTSIFQATTHPADVMAFQGDELGCEPRTQGVAALCPGLTCRNPFRAMVISVWKCFFAVLKF